jgi:4'-phosphopantetheinyl transferase
MFSGLVAGYVFQLKLAMTNLPQVWLLDCDQTISAEELSLLDRNEQERLRRLSRPEDKAAFVKAHAGRRLLLSRQLNVHPSKIQFVYSPLGKPALSPQLAGENLDLSISHTTGYVALVLSQRGAVGIDVERRREVANVLALARDMFGFELARRLAAFSPKLRQGIFLKMWTMAEAYAKATGLGLASLPSGFALHLTTAGQPNLANSSAWSLLDPDFPTDCVGSVIAKKQSPKLDECQAGAIKVKRVLL